MDKKTIEAKEGYIMKRNAIDMMNCDTLTYEQHIALATLAGARHELHTHSDRLFDTSIEQNTVIDYFDPNTERNAAHELEEAGLPTIECVFDREDPDFPDRSVWDYVVSPGEVEEYEDRAEEEGYPDGYSLWLEESGMFEEWCGTCEKQNAIVEEYLANIDAEHGTHYAPTGHARARLY